MTLTTKTGKYKGHPGSALACGYFDRKESLV